MKKIGICTLYYKNRNYGANLQAYALQQTLKSLGCDAYLIPYYRLSAFFDQEWREWFDIQKWKAATA